jgi:hypothetical protein
MPTFSSLSDGLGCWAPAIHHPYSVARWTARDTRTTLPLEPRLQSLADYSRASVPGERR